MLVSVTERTREIGLRLAVGALKNEVLLQFLIEAVVLSALGGAVGVLLATLASYGLSDLMGIPYAFDPQINVLALLFSLFIGVVFGYFPARRQHRWTRSRRCPMNRLRPRAVLYGLGRKLLFSVPITDLSTHRLPLARESGAGSRGGDAGSGVKRPGMFPGALTYWGRS